MGRYIQLPLSKKEADFLWVIMNSVADSTEDKSVHRDAKRIVARINRLEAGRPLPQRETKA